MTDKGLERLQMLLEAGKADEIDADDIKDLIDAVIAKGHIEALTKVKAELEKIEACCPESWVKASAQYALTQLSPLF